MNLLEMAKEYAPAINALALLLVLFKLALDGRRQRLEREKLERELTALRDRETEAAAKLLKVSAEDVQQQVIAPLLKAQAQRDKEIQDAHRRLIEAFYQAATGVHENLQKRDRELQDSQRLVVEAFFQAASSIRENTERAAVGGKLSTLLQENTRALMDFRNRLAGSAESVPASPTPPLER